jgi:hypothetical protein
MEPVRLGLMDEAVRYLGEELFVTCTYAVFDPFTKECRIANAGHPPPLWVRHVCKPAYEVPPNVPLGIGGSNFSEAVVTLKPGDSLLFYTDGVVERRDLPWDAATSGNLTRPAAGRGLAGRLPDALIDAIPAPPGRRRPRRSVHRRRAALHVLQSPADRYRRGRREAAHARHAHRVGDA